MKAIIPAAGYGTRFLPIAKIVPKELLPIGNKPAIQYVVEEAVASGITEIVLVCHRSKWSILDYFQADSQLNVFLQKRGKGKELEELSRIESLAKFEVVYQDEAMGLGHAVWCAREAVGGEPFLVLLPDVVIVSEVPATRQLMEGCRGEGGWGLLLERVSKERVSSYGIVRGERLREGVWSLEGAVEKPAPEEAPSDLGILGRYLFPPEIFELLEGLKGGALGEIQLTDAIDLLARKKPGRGILAEGDLFDVGTPEGLFAAQEFFRKSPRREG